MRRLWVMAAVLVASEGMAAGQAAGSGGANGGMGGGLALLQRVTKRYADATSYDVRAVEERWFEGEFSRQWSKVVMRAAEAPGGRSYFEGDGGMGHAVRVSDGTTSWTYRAGAQRYTARPRQAAGAGLTDVIPMSEMGAQMAKTLRGRIGELAEPFRSAERLPDATLEVEGRAVRCAVVRVTDRDRKRLRPLQTIEKTIWIDAGAETILKVEEHEASPELTPGATMPMKVAATTTYTTAAWDAAPREALFAWKPPAGAKEVASFPDPMKEMYGTSHVGEPAPAMTLRGADGKTVSLASFRGKPVLVDVWATTCAPCVAGLPELAKIAQETESKGLVVLTIDIDDDASKATELLAKKGLRLRNFHDGDGELEKTLGAVAIPRVLLVDAQGKVAFEATGADDDTVRMEIAQLGPEFAGIAPKPKQPACVAQR